MRNFFNIFLLALLVMSLSNNTYAQWENLGDPGFSDGVADNTDLAFDDSGTPYVVYKDRANGDKATVMKHNGTDWEVVGTIGFSAGVATWTTLAIFDGTPYVAYNDAANSGVTVKKFDGSNWVTVGATAFSAGAAEWISLAFNSSGTPYVSYTDNENGYEATVMKFNGSNWEPVGTEGFSGGQSVYTSLAFNDADIPHVAFRSESHGYKAVVMKYNGTSWEPLGGGGLSPDYVDFTCLAFDNSDIPYVAFADDTQSKKATVMKFNGTNWEMVGSQGFSIGGAYYNSLAFDSFNTPYLAYSDWGNSRKATVMKYNGSNWEPVGTEGFSSGFDSYISLALDNSGTPHVAFQDNGNSEKASVMKFPPTIWDGSSWDNGAPSASDNAIIDGNYTEATGFECANLTLNADLIIPAGTEITVNGAIDGTGQIHLQSSSIPVPYYNYDIGSLIHTTDGRAGSVQRYLSGSQWHLVQTPAGSFTVQDVFTGDWVYAYNNSAAWEQLQWGDLFSEDEGYLVWSSDDETKLFEGNLNAGTISFTPPAMGDYALVGNPYPSPIDWALVDKTGIQNTAHIWDAANGTYATHNGTTGTGCFVLGAIPPTQGFLINNETKLSLFELTDAVRKHPSGFAFAKSGSDLVRLYLEAPASTSELVVYAEDAAANGLDELDSKKLFSFVAESSEVYALVGNEPVAINALKSITDNTVVPLGLTVGTNGTHTFNLDASEFEGQVYLEDTETGVFTDLTAAPYTLSLATGDFDNRFVLHFATTTTDVESVTETAVNIYSFAEKAYINTNGETAQSVEVYTLSGRLIYSDFNSFEGIRSFEVPATGVYIIKVQTENGATTERVVIN